MLYFCDTALHNSRLNMPKGTNNMEKNSDEYFIIMQAAIENNKQDIKADIKANKQDSDEKMMQLKAKMKSNKQNSDEKMMQFTETLKVLTEFMMDKTKNSKYSPTQKDTLTPPDPITMIPSNRRSPPLEGGHSTKIGGMWTLKHEIISPKFYELLIKTELKGDTDLDLKNFYNHTNMCLNAVTRIR